MYRLSFTFLLLMTLAGTASARTEIGGRLDSSMTWSRADAPYIVTSTLTIGALATVTIEPGVQVLFSAGTFMQVEGALVAQGTARDPIRFTSGVFPQQTGDWLGIIIRSTGGTTFDSSANRIGGSIFEHVEFRCAAQALDIIDAGLVIDSCRFEQNGAGLRITNTRHLFVRGNVFRVNEGAIILAYERPGFGDELYDTRITGNIVEQEREALISLQHARISWLEIAHNRMRDESARISVVGAVPFDVRSVHIHHNLIESAWGALVLGLSPSQPLSDPSLNHALIERNIFVRAFDAPGVDQVGIMINGTAGARIFAGMNTFVGWQSGLDLRGDAVSQFGMNTMVATGIGARLSGDGDSASHGSIMFNTFAYNRGSIFAISAGARYSLAANDLLQFDELAFRLLSGDDVEAGENFWGSGVGEAEAERRIHDSLDNAMLGRVRFRPMAPRGVFGGPLVPPRNVHAHAFGVVADVPSILVRWSRSPDPRVTGYRVWYARLNDGTFAGSMDFTDTTGIIPIEWDAALYDIVAVTAFRNDAKGLPDQLEGHESWFSCGVVEYLMGIRERPRLPFELDLW